MLPVRRDVHPAGEAVKPDQRVHIETARHGFVLDHLAHEADIPVELEPLPEKPGRGAQVEVMAHQAVRTRDSPLGRIGIGKIVLHLFRPGGNRDRIHRRDPRPEKVARIVVGLHPRTGAPAFHPAAHPVAVLERRQAEGGLERKVRSERHGLLFAGVALFGRNEDHAVGRPDCRTRRAAGAPLRIETLSISSALRFEMPSPPSRFPASATPPMAE